MERPSSKRLIRRRGIQGRTVRELLRETVFDRMRPLLENLSTSGGLTHRLRPPTPAPQQPRCKKHPPSAFGFLVALGFVGAFFSLSPSLNEAFTCVGSHGRDGVAWGSQRRDTSLIDV